MKKKGLYVITQTIIGLVSHSVDTNVIGLTKDKDVAKRILREEYDRMAIKLGNEYLFETTDWEVSCKSEYVVCKYQIKIATYL